MMISFLLSEIFEGFVEDLFSHLEGERSEIVTKPALSIKHLEIAKILKHFNVCQQTLTPVMVTHR